MWKQAKIIQKCNPQIFVDKQTNQNTQAEQVKKKTL